MAPPPRGRFRRWMRRALIGLVAATLGLLVVLHLPPVQHWLVSTALSALRRGSRSTSRGATSRSTCHAVRADSGLAARRARRLRAAGLRRAGLGAGSPSVCSAESSTASTSRWRTGTVTLARENGQWSTIPAAWTRSTPGRPPRSLPAFAALRLHDIAVVYDDRDARFRTETKGLRVELLPTGLRRRSGGRPGRRAPLRSCAGNRAARR